MPQPLPKDSYLFSKLDKEFRHIYINNHYQTLFDVTPEVILGKTLSEIRFPNMPQCLLDESLDRVSQKGYSYILIPHKTRSGDILWGFVDLTRRFGAAANSGMIGYEFVSYPASQPAIDFFAPLYEEVLQLENTHRDASIAVDHFNKRVAESGKTYDELIHVLQNA